MNKLLEQINLVAGKLVCFFKKSHREPFTTIRHYPYDITFCNRCGKIISTKKIGRTFAEIWHDEYFNHGNQIW